MFTLQIIGQDSPSLNKKALRFTSYLRSIVSFSQILLHYCFKYKAYDRSKYNYSMNTFEIEKTVYSRNDLSFQLSQNSLPPLIVKKISLLLLSRKEHCVKDNDWVQSYYKRIPQFIEFIRWVFQKFFSNPKSADKKINKIIYFYKYEEQFIWKFHRKYDSFQ